MKDNGSQILLYGKVKAYKCGLTALRMRATGLTTRRTAREDSFMQMAMYMTVTGWTTKLTASEHTAIWMEPNIEENGKKTSNMVGD